MCENGNSKKLALGLVFIVAGFLFLLNKLNFIPYHVADHLFSWQMLLIAIGAVSIAGHKRNFAGWIMIGVGGFFLLTDIVTIPATFRDIFWPMLIILIGLVIILRRPIEGSGSFIKKHGHRNSTISDNESTFEDVTIFGGNKKNYQLKNLRMGKVVAVFGGSEIDLRNCQLSEDGAVLEVFNMFGGSTLILPEDWVVKSDIVAIFGGFDESKKPIGNINDNKVLYVKGLAIFGGGEVKRY